MRRLVLLGILASIVGASAAEATPGDLDSSYGGGSGWSRLDFSSVPGATDPTSSDRGYSLALQEDGKILVGGYSSAGGGRKLAVARLLSPQGSFDPSFAGGAGAAVIDLHEGPGGTFSSDELRTAMVLRPQGQIVIAGNTYQNFDMAVAQLTSPQATLDASFHPDFGWTPIDLGGNPESIERASAVGLQPDGQVVVAGTSNRKGTSDIAVARLLSPKGTLDPSFGNTGGVSLIDLKLPPRPSASESVRAMVLQPDSNRILVAGDTNLAGTSDLMVARLVSPSGELDNNYGNGFGWSRIDFGGLPGATKSNDVGNAMAVQPDGKILVVGSSDAFGTDRFAITRLRSPQGTFDTTFGDGRGLETIDFPGNGTDQAYATTVQPDGKILLAGTVDGNGNGGDIGVARLQPDGTLDTTFGDGGTKVIDLKGNENVRAMVLQNDGKILVAGTSDVQGTNDMFVARLDGDSGGMGGTGGTGGSGGSGGAGGGPGGGSGSGPAKGGRPPRCAGRAATIVGTNGKDKLRGSKRADVIVGLGGNDKIVAGGGNDVICAGAGNDRADGGSGKDRVYGQSGKDSLIGGTGADRLYGGSGNDRIAGKSGNDYLAGGAGNDRLDGGPGNDGLFGQSGRDTLFGRGGRDRLNGGPGRDRQHQ